MKEFVSLRLLLTGLLGVLLSPWLALGQENLAVETVTGPFPYSVCENAWVIRQPRVVNFSGADRRVRVIYRTSSPYFGQTFFTSPVTVKAGTARTITLPIWMHGMTVVGAGKADLKNVEEICDLVDDQSPNGERLFHHILHKALWKPQSVICYSEYSEYPVPGGDVSYLPTTGELGDDLVTGAVKPMDLPDRWYGYGAIKVLILGHFKADLVRQEQWNALLQWVRAGGTLVITGSMECEGLLQGELAAAAGVSVQGVHSVSSLDVPSLKLPEPVRLKKPLPMMHLCAGEAKVVAEANGMPLLTQRTLDNGSIFTLAVPVGALAPAPLSGLWKPVGQACRAVPPVRNDESFIQRATKGFTKTPGPAASQTGPEVLKQIAGRPAPGRWVPMMVLLGLASGVVLVGAALMIRRRGEFIWVILLPLTLAIGLGMYIYGNSRVDPPRLSYVGLMTGTTDGQAMVQEAMAYYSGQFADPETVFQAGNQQATIRMLPSLSGQATLNSVRTDMRTQMELPCEIASNDGRTFLVQSIMPEAGLESELTFGPDGLTGRVVNHLQAELSDAIVYVNRQAYRLPNLPDKGEVTVSVTDGAKLGQDEFTGKDVKSPADNLRNQLLAQCAGRGRDVRGGAMIIGCMERSPLRPLEKEGLARQGWTVVAWPVCFVPPQKGRVVVPSGFVQKTFGASSVYDPLGEQFLPSHLPAEMTVSASAPAIVGPLKDLQAHLRVAMRAPNYRLTVYGLTGGKAGGAKTKLRSFENPSGIYTLDVPHASRFSDSGGRFMLLLEMTPLAPPIPGGLGASETPPGDLGASGRDTTATRPPDAGASAVWQLQSIDVSLEGIRP